MTKKVQTPETDIMVESKTKIESFFDKFGSKVMWGLVAVTVIAVGIFFFINRNEKKNAAEEAAARQAATEVVYQSTNIMTGETSLDIDYAATAEAYMAIANEHPETASGNMCYFLAASNYLYAGDLANAKAALAKLQKVEGDFGKHMNAMALTLKGDIAVEEKDFALQSRLNWFVDEQVEEEENATELVHKLRLIGDNGYGLYQLDQELATRVYTQASPLATAE